MLQLVESIDHRVLELVMAGHHSAALHILMKTEGAIVYAFCRRTLKDTTLAKDVYQEVFLNAYEAMPRFAGGSSLRTWLMGIARCRTCDALRARRRESARFVFDDELLAEATSVGPDPYERDGLDRAKDALESCLENCVSQEERHLILLSYRDGLSYQEMGDRFGRKPDTLRARVARALPKLRRGLGRQELRRYFGRQGIGALN